MFEIEIPDEMPAEQFDCRMASGWFRSGPIFFRADRFCLEEEVRALVHVRLPIEGYVPSRSRRRRLHRNRARFRCRVGRARVEVEHRRLYDAMKPRFTGFVSRELDPLVLGLTPGVFEIASSR